MIGSACGPWCLGCYAKRRDSRLVGFLTCMDGRLVFETFWWGGGRVGTWRLELDLFVLLFGSRRSAIPRNHDIVTTISLAGHFHKEITSRKIDRISCCDAINVQ